MLCQFSVRNFGCIKDTATLDLQATTLSEHRNSVFIDVDQERFLPLAVIYGPNGAGKSTVLQAIYMFVLLIMRPVQVAAFSYETSKEHTEHIDATARIIPFKFSDQTKSKPTTFEVFFRTNHNEYEYSIHVLKNRITYESLRKKSLDGQKYSMMFERNNQNVVLKSTFRTYSVDDIPNHLPVLSYLIITHGRNQTLCDIRRWFENYIEIVDFGNPNMDRAIYVVDDHKKKLVLQMFKEMDIDISDYRITTENGKLKNIFTKHTIGEKEYEIDLADESQGTFKLFYVLPLIINCLLIGKTVVIDELDAKLHPILLKYIIELFTNPEINKKRAQLLFTSQDISTMSLDILRRDEIWFVAKSAEQATKLYSLVEFKNARKDAVINKQYLEGRYGADPYLKKIINWSTEA